MAFTRTVAREVAGYGITANRVAPAVAFLSSEKAGFITGQTLSVSGGLSWLEPCTPPVAPGCGFLTMMPIRPLAPRREHTGRGLSLLTSVSPRPPRPPPPGQGDRVLSNKLLLGCGALSLLVTLAGYIVYASHRAAILELERVAEITAPRLLALEQIRWATLTLYEGAVSAAFILSEDQRMEKPGDHGAEVETHVREIHQARELYLRGSRRHRELTVMPPDRSLLDAIGSQGQSLFEMAMALIEMKRSEVYGGWPLAKRWKLRETQESLLARLNKTIEAERAQLAILNAAIDLGATRARTMGWIATIAALPLCVVLGAGATQAIRGPLERRMRSAQIKAEAASAAKSEFLAGVSHAVRTPLTAMLGFIDLLGEDALTAQEQQDHVATLRRNGEHLLAIVDNLLDLSMIESDQLDLERRPTSPEQILTDVGSLMRGAAAEKNLELVLETPDDLPAQIMTDPTRVGQILVNLVSNAIRFTETGTVRLVIRKAADEEWLSFEVHDTGPGLLLSQQASVRRAVLEGDTSSTRRFGGLGLGLCISCRFSELLGGGLEVESRLGEGTRFTLTIPTGRPRDGGSSEPPPWKTPHEPQGNPLGRAEPARLSGRVLLAEDVPDTRLIVRNILEKAGLEVTETANGRTTLEQARQALEEGRPFDIILMDTDMPELDGHQVTSQLRSEGYAHPIIALTAHSMPEDRGRCLAAGCDDYLSQPVNRLALIALIRSYLDKRSAES